MTVGSLFAGIGGFDLGFERAGYEIKWQVEINGFCRAVLRKHWPQVSKYADVRRVGAHNLERVDVICGGFPCQDISVAGSGAGLAGARSGLWFEYRRIIRELRPSYVVVENVSALLGRGLGRVLGDLAACGFDAEWDCLPASSFGAPHQRDRVWIVAYTDSRRQQERAQFDGQAPEDTAHRHPRREHADGLRHALADTGCDRLEGPLQAGDSQCTCARVFQGRAFIGRGLEAGTEQWHTEPDVGRVAHGIPQRVDRLRGLGNAIVPQIAEWIAYRIQEAEALTGRDRGEGRE